MERLNPESIVKVFNQLGIPVDKLPTYENANTFTAQFVKCSVLEYANTIYSKSTFEQPNQK